MSLLLVTNTIQRNELQKQLDNSISVTELQFRLDEFEKMDEQAFQSFSDIEMIYWYLHERKHLHAHNDRTARTIYEYKREILMFVEYIVKYAEEIPVDLTDIIEGSLFKSLEKRHIRRYQEWLATKSPYIRSGREYSPATLERKTTIIKSFLSYLYEGKYITKPIHEGFRIASVRKDDRPNRDLGPKDVIHLLNLFQNIHHPIMFGIIHVLTTTGIRNEEFCTLTVQDLQKDSILGHYYIDVLGKGNKRRQIPIKSKVLQSIIAYRTARGLVSFHDAAPNEPLFTTNTGRSFSPSYLSQYVKSQIDRHAKEEQLPKYVTITPHVFRHAFAIISKVNGVDIYDIMRSLGHEKIETTMIYLEKVFEKEKHAIHQWKPELFGQYI